MHLLADGLVERLGLKPPSLVIDIGCNDGTLLAEFKRHGLHTLGVEPTNVGGIARNVSGVEVLQRFFGESLAREIARDYGQAQLITMTNVFAHIAGLGDVMRGLCECLAPDGVFVTESHYLLDVLERNQVDTVYHEHIRTYSLKSLAKLFPSYGMEVFDVERSDRYGGNIRAYVARKGKRPLSTRVGELLALEERSGLHRPDAWKAFRQRVYDNRDRFMEFLFDARRQGRTVVGNSCPGRGVTLLNFYGVTRDMMPYLGELPGSLKLGLHTPGGHIPVVENKRIVQEQPDYLVLLAWHYKDAIAKRVRAEGVRSTLVVPLPEFAVLEA
jgi:SAM-dependent methyltransferase